MIIDILGLEEKQWADFFYRCPNPIWDFLQQMTEQQMFVQLCIPQMTFTADVPGCFVDCTVTYE